MKRALFIDRDGTLVQEVPHTHQLDDPAHIIFYPKVIRNLFLLRKHTDFELVMVSNQDGLGTPAFPQARFDACQGIILRTLAGEGIVFDNILIDPSFPQDGSPRRKPGTAMLTQYLSGDYDLSRSFVIGDRLSDIQLAANLGAQAIRLHPQPFPQDLPPDLPVALVTDDWDRVAAYIAGGPRQASVHRHTHETDVRLSLNLDGQGLSHIHTGLGMLNHLLEQIARHGDIDLHVDVHGDLHVDEHHTLEDTALALGEAFRLALGDKRGIERYGFVLPMDECRAMVTLDFGGRPSFIWQAHFARERIGDLPTELFFHFFKSLSDAALLNIHIQADGANEHHKIEAIFKAFARALRMALRRDVRHARLPSTKGVL
ncbi:MAG: bifunctional histidinol-phosphatase/imidazoleglycerol-phosphate dehydratase HisB [Tannerellaceae bacterium]|jgi:imidazoleglycerol-phosphate dehydratase/histidinol-phosphatase|nr:bifunctional histidinol-phosphatase/imidazoleglycerol-phosphate dehydratase HisB [Tannerellaceae bacterium]